MVPETAELLKYTQESDTYYMEKDWKAICMYVTNPTKVIAVKNV